MWANSTAGQASFTVSGNGTLAYVNASLYNSQLTWLDRSGRELSVLGPPGRFTGQVPQLSPDDEQLAITRGLWAEEQIWLLRLRDGASTRLTYDRHRATRPVWSADGERIMYGSHDALLSTGFTVWIKQVDGGREEEVYTGPGHEVLDWSADGRFAVYLAAAPATRSDIWLLPIDGEGEPLPLLATSAVEYQAQISPNGRWIAYVSDESGL